MSVLASDLVDDVRRRVRDYAGTMTATNTPPTIESSDAFIRTTLDAAQLFVNLQERLLVDATNLYLTAAQPLYHLPNIFPNYAGKVVGCNVAGVAEIDGPVDWRTLGRASRTWLTDLAAPTLTAPLSWSVIGKTLLALVPAFPTPTPTVTVRYATVPPTLTSDAVALAVPDMSAEHVARLSTILCLLKTRQLTDFDNKLQALASDMKLLDKLQTTGGKAD